MLTMKGRHVLRLLSVSWALLLVKGSSQTEVTTSTTTTITTATTATATVTTTTSIKNKGILILPLIPSDSPEGRRRRRRRRRQRRFRRHLIKEEIVAKNSNNTSNAENPEDAAANNENPLQLHPSVLYEGYGVHYVDLWVGCGTPQRVTVIVDTGSSVTAFPCAGCQQCGGSSDNETELYHTDAVYQQDTSTCFESVSSEKDCWVGQWADGDCRASKHYSEGSSWEAFEAIDQVYTGGDHTRADQNLAKKESFRLHFGCQDKVTGLFQTQLADGIMGMYDATEAFWSQMYHANKMKQQAYSLCFAEPGHVDRKGTLAGAMVLGGSDTRLHTTPMVYAELMSKRGKFHLHLEKVYLQETRFDGDTININPPISSDLTTLNNVQIFEEALNNKGPVILDSGTTATYLTKTLERHFVNVFNDLVSEDIMEMAGNSRGVQKTYELTLRQLYQLPTIVFMIKAWQPPNSDDDNAKHDLSEKTHIPGMVGSDMDPRHAGHSILLRMPAQNYMARVHDDDMEEVDLTDLDSTATYNFHVFFTKQAGHGGVLGANVMQGHDILFDMDNQRIGFAESTCEYEVLADDEEDS